MLSLVGIIVGLALLIFLAFRGKSLLWAAPVCALLVAFTGGLDVRDRAIASLFPIPPLAALLGRDKVHAVAFDRLS